MYSYFRKMLRKAFQPTTPIFINELIELFPQYSRVYLYRLIKFAEMREDLIKFSQGVYYIPEMTRFGVSTIVAEMVIDKRYIKNNDNVFGVYSGLKLLNMFSVTTQVPNTIELTTNNESTRKRLITLDGMNFILKTSRFEINNDNYKYYILLELFTLIKPYEEISYYAIKKIENYIAINDLSIKELLNYAMFFPSKTLKNIVRSGIL